MVKLFLLASLLLPSAARAQMDDSAPNIVVIDICAARADHFSSYGYPKRTTPGMDAVAEDGVLFENAMAQASWCLSNYATLFTGHTPEVHGLYAMTDRKLPEEQVTVTQVLKDWGYDTGAWSGGTWLLPQWGLERGFDNYVNTLSSTAVLTAFSTRMPEMLDWVRQRKKPFFLYASIEDLHLPYAQEISLVADPNSNVVSLGTGTARTPLLREKDGSATKPQDPPEPAPWLAPLHSGAKPRYVKKYDGSLSRADKQIAKFLDELKAMGLWDKTVVIITGDHGESLGEHGIKGHMEGLYQASTHVPLIIRHPGLPELRGRRFSELIERVDLAPTLLDIAGAPYDGLEFQGRSLLSLMRQPGLPWRQYAFGSSKRSVDFPTGPTDLILDERYARTQRWKLHWYMRKGRFELYDLHNDPGELFDVSAQHPDVVSNLAFELIKNLETTRPHAPGLPSGRPPLRPAELSQTRPNE
ncbi:MAG: sulfatase [Elusimicrobiota bacterium]